MLALTLNPSNVISPVELQQQWPGRRSGRPNTGPVAAGNLRAQLHSARRAGLQRGEGQGGLHCVCQDDAVLLTQLEALACAARSVVVDCRRVAHQQLAGRDSPVVEVQVSATVGCDVGVGRAAAIGTASIFSPQRLPLNVDSAVPAQQMRRSGSDFVI